METLVVDGGHLEPVPGSTIAPNPVFWSAIVGGAIVAAALSSVLLAFGSAIGLAVVSTSPSWHDSSFALWFASGLYLVFVALAAFGCGGYIAGRLRPRHAPAPQPVEHERQLRDGLRGLMSWALAVVIAGFVAAGVAAISGAAATAAPSTPLTSSGESILSSELDRLFRSDQHVGDGDFLYRRAEASRILMTAGSHDGVTNEDRDYLVALVSGVNKIPAADAEARTTRAIADARTAISNARKAGILEAFMIAAALVLGAALAWVAAVEGGQERDTGTLPNWVPWRRPEAVRAA
jgi:hypothetical protein